MNNANDKALILIDKYHSGQATEDEVHRLKQWKNSSSSNTKLFDDFIKLLELINNLKDWKQFDKQKAWSVFQSRIGTKGLRITRQVMAIAAILLFVLAATFYNFAGKSSSATGAYISGLDDRYSVLVDGSELFLNKDAAIYTSNFSSDARFLRTEGSFFVNVSHNEASPFSLETERIAIKVLGTSFKVYETDAETIVKVRDGKVLITNYDGSTYTITKGEQLKVSEDRSVSISKVADEDWGLFNKSYEDESLFNVVNDLASKYGNLKISASAVNMSCRITTKIQSSTILEILEELDLIFDIDYSVKEGIIVVEKISC